MSNFYILDLENFTTASRRYTIQVISTTRPWSVCLRHLPNLSRYLMIPCILFIHLFLHVLLPRIFNPFSDRPRILSTRIRSSEITWTSRVRLQHHSIFSPRQTCSHRQQTLQAPVSIKPMVFRHLPRISVHLSPR